MIRTGDQVGYEGAIYALQKQKGFLLYLLCSDRPINEIIIPNFQDQRSALNNQFIGMTNIAFGYDEYEHIREKLVQTIHANLTEKDKEFLLSVKNACLTTQSNCLAEECKQTKFLGRTGDLPDIHVGTLQPLSQLPKKRSTIM